MTNVMKYKDYIGSVEFSAEDEVFYGKLEAVNDLVTFEASSVDELKNAFQEAVEDYLALCKKAGKDPNKSYKGSFNVRVKPELHRLAALKSVEMGMSLNQLVEEALAKFVKVKRS